MRFLITVAIVLALSSGLNPLERFADNGDGTVKDAKTGLVWMKCSAGQDVPDCSGKAIDMNWDAAFKYCNSLALAGKKWRLPTVDELQTILDRSTINPAIDTIYTNFFPNTMGLYWSSSITAQDASWAWSVSFYDGRVSFLAMAQGYRVRCMTVGP